MLENTNTSSSTALCDVVINLDDATLALSAADQGDGEYLLGAITERLSDALVAVDEEQLGHAFWSLLNGMSHTGAAAYLDGEAVDVPLSGAYTPCLYSTPQGCAVPCRYVALHTFLVDAQAHFTYAYITDQLMLHALEKQQLTQGIEAQAEAARERFEQRVRYLKPCQLERHASETRACALCHVLYTRADSEFYQRCCARIKASTHVDFVETSSEYMELERLSFQLVLFLCGAQLLAEETTANGVPCYAATNQWIRVPVWFLLLYSERA